MKFSDRLRELWHRSTKVSALTGAGVSRESGVPTFRDKDGLWQKFKPEELANMDAFLRNPDLVWGWYEHRRQVLRDIEPNPGHYALAEMEKLFPSFTLITQNVDGLHQRAGSNRVVEIHGNIMRSFCVSCGKFASFEHLESVVEAHQAICDACGGRLRPDVVWFGEMLPVEAYEKAQAAARDCDLFFTIGTSGVVYPAAGLPLLARESGAYVVEINPERTEISPFVDEVLSGTSAQILPALLKELGTP